MYINKNKEKDVTLEDEIREIVGKNAEIAGEEWDIYKNTGKMPKKIKVKSPNVKWYKSIKYRGITINIYPQNA